MRRQFLPLIVSLALLSGCSQTPSTPSTPQASGSPTTSTSMTPTAGLSAEDESLFKEIVAKSLAERAMGELAGEQAASADVKAVAQKMVDDQAQMTDQFEKLAAAKNVQLPTEPSADVRQQLDDLGKLNGSEFDQKFLAEEVEQHRNNIEFYSEGAKRASDPELKSLAETSLVILRMHLDKLARLSPPK